MIKVILKDGSTMEIEEGTSILEVAKKISEGLARNVTCGEINGEIRDIRYKIKEDCNLILHTFKNDDLCCAEKADKFCTAPSFGDYKI